MTAAATLQRRPAQRWELRAIQVRSASAGAGVVAVVASGPKAQLRRAPWLLPH